MGASIYGNVSGASRKAKDLYAKVNGVNRKIKGEYAKVNGVVRKVYQSVPSTLNASVSTSGLSASYNLSNNGMTLNADTDPGDTLAIAQITLFNPYKINIDERNTEVEGIVEFEYTIAKKYSSVDHSNYFFYFYKNTEAGSVQNSNIVQPEYGSGSVNASLPFDANSEAVITSIKIELNHSVTFSGQFYIISKYSDYQYKIPIHMVM